MYRHVSLLGRLIINRAAFNKCTKINLQNVSVRYVITGHKTQQKPFKTVQDANYKKKRAFSLEDLLQYINSGKVFYLKQLTHVLPTTDFDKLKPEEAVLLLKCCGSSVPDSSRTQRNRICQDIFNGLQTCNNTNLNIYNTYLQICNDNNVYVNPKDFLATMKSEPNKDTFKILLKNVCQLGKITDALEILDLMKSANISLDLDIFNDLILAHTIEGGLDLAESVLGTMRSTHIPETNSTRLALLLGTIKRNDLNEFKKVNNEYGITFTDCELLKVVEEIGLQGNDSWLLEINKHDKDVFITRENQLELEKVCIHLIHMGKPVSAMNIYQEFIRPTQETIYGYSLLKEMLHCNIDISTIVSIAKKLVENGPNEYILENITELALRFGYVNQAWALLASLKVVRPHYFWPLLIQSSKKEGEEGLFTTMEKMRKFNVKPDAETLAKYVLPYCDKNRLKNLVLKLQDSGFTVKEILSPLLTVMLKEKKVKQAVYLCNLYNVNIIGEDLFKLFSTTWDLTKDTNSILTLLQRYCESNIVEPDLVGRFLIDCCKLCKSESDFKEYLKLVKTVGKNRLRISTYSGDVLKELSYQCTEKSLKDEIHASVNHIMDLSKLTEDTVLVHPRNMDLAGLECHLIELKEKKMEIRGVLKRLIQMHANQGNIQRVIELRKLFLESGYEESAGVKSSIMHSFVLGGYFDEALAIYKEIKKLHPEFSLDSFKYIDLAKLLILNNNFNEGYSILKHEVAIIKKFGNTKAIVRNCRELLSACKTGEEGDKIFTLLKNSGLLEPTNVILGPLVKVYLKSGDLNFAVHKFLELSEKYRCTPLQLEILCIVTKEENSELLQKVIKAVEIVHGSGAAQLGLIAALAENGQYNALRKTLAFLELSEKYRCTPLQLEILCIVTKEENSELLQKVIKAVEIVHGSGAAQLGLIAALAENGQYNALRKTLASCNVPIKGLLQQRCKRWMEEGKLEPLKCLLKACDRLSEDFINVQYIYKCIFDLYDLNRNYAGAISFYENILEHSTIRMSLEKDFQRILAKNNESKYVQINNKM